MKKKHHLFNYVLAAVFAVITGSFTAQNSAGNVSPNGTFDKVFDRFGTEYALRDLAITTVKSQTFTTCSSGYFNLYFENGSGFEQNTTAHINRRNVLCQLFSDLSNFITPANPAQKVNIWVRDVNNIVPNAAVMGVLGVATSFYALPSGAPAVTGIADGEVWRTIKSGQDSYTGVAPPLFVTGGQSSGFYHGLVAFSFNSSSVLWHTDLATATGAGLYDLYTVGLHEITHALGFASLIGANGLSRLSAAGYNYYSRYDQFLRTVSNQSLITNSGPCTLYNYGFNSALTAATVLSPNAANCVTDNTSCGTAVRYVGSVTQPVYTPNCFEPGSSLSHFEDQCHLPSAYANNAHYVMSNANGTGATYMKRYLKEEERKVLCDLGYNVGATYGGGLYASINHTYTAAACPGTAVAGVNDGISNGIYNFEITAGQTASIPGWFILGNDFGATGFECLQDVYGNGSLNITSGNSSSTILYTAGTPGTALLRYVPVNSLGQKGNITYIFVRINSGNCFAEACNMVTNGEFESVVGTCQTFVSLSCWNILTSSPDLFSRNCPSYPVPAYYSTPYSESWNNGANNNDHFAGLFGGANGTGYIDEESIQTLLTSPLVPGNSYTLRFRAKVAASAFQGFMNIPANIAVCASPGSMASLGGTGDDYDLTYPGLTVLLPSIIIPADNNWHYVMQTFVYNGTGSLNNLIIGYDASATPATNPRYVYLDAVELNPTGSTPLFSPVNPLCQGDVLTNLQQYADPVGGTFTGPNVTSSGGIYTFNASTVGTFEVTYNYTNGMGCPYSVPVQVVVNPQATPTLNIVASETIVCQGAPVTVTVTGAASFTWSPAVACANACSQVTITPLASTVYTITGSNGLGCTTTQTLLIAVSGPSICCSKPYAAIPDGGSSSSYGSFDNQLIEVTGNFNINTNAVYTNVLFRMLPGSKITVGSTSMLTLKNCHLFACTNMWEGIYLTQSGGAAATLIVMNNSSIEDAKEGVVANANGTAASSTIKFENSTMNKNYRSFQISNYTGTSPYPFGIKSSTISCAGSAYSPGNTLKPPYSGRSYAGITLVNVNKVIVGLASSASTNYFSNTNYGIYALASDLKAVNNNFSDLDGGRPYCLAPPAPPCFLPGIAILAPNQSPTTKTVVIGGTAAYEPNTFTDAMQAVNLNYLGATSVIKNTFNCSATSPSFPQGVSTGYIGYSGIVLANINGELNVKLNNLTNFSTAIYYTRNSGTFNYNPLATIQSNNINSNVSGYTKIGIDADDAAGNSITGGTTLMIKDNTLAGISQYGIRVSNIRNAPLVTSSSGYAQSVNMLYAASGTRNGIYINSCEKAIVTNNYVLSSSKNNTTMSGICLNTSINSLVRCNYLSTIGTALTITGDCTGPYAAGTAYAYGIIANTFLGNAVGISFKTNGRVGTQGDATHPSGNIWTTTPATMYNLGQTRTDATSLPANSIFYCRNTPATVWPVNHQGSTIYTNNNTIALATSGSAPSCPAFPIIGIPGGGETGRLFSTAIEATGDDTPVSLNIYPNPNSGLFYIESSSELSDVTIRVIDLVGKVVLQKTIKKLDKEMLDLGEADSGLYNIEITSGQTTRYFKLVKQ